MAWLATVAAALIGAGSQASAAEKQKSAGLTGSALANQPKGGGSNFAPTALTLEAQQKQPDIGSMGLQDLVGNQKNQSLFQGTELGKGFDYSSGAEPKDTVPISGSVAGAPPWQGDYARSAPPASSDADFHLSSDFGKIDNLSSVQSAAPAATGAAASATGGNNYAQYANAASGILGQLMQKQQVPGAQIPQPGQMNYQPTALSLLARRNPYGGY